MQSEPTDAYFERLAAGGYQPLLHQVSGTLRFDIDQSDGRQHRWYVTIDHGNLTVRRDEDAERSDEVAVAADCILAAHEDEFLSILSGQDSFVAAFLRGAVSVTGDSMLAENIRRFSPPAEVLPGALHENGSADAQP
jgi:putative sterol carrier protein